MLRRSLIGVLLLALVTLLWRCADAPPEPVAPSDAPSDGVAAVMSAAISAPERAREVSPGGANAPASAATSSSSSIQSAPATLAPAPHNPRPADLGALFGARDSAVLWQRLMTQRGRYDDPITAQVAQEFLALLPICGLYAQLLKPGKSDALALLVEGPIATSSADIAYITHFCDALFKSRGTLSLSAERGARRFEPFQLAHPLLDLGELAYVIEQDALTDAELGFVLRHSRSPHVLTSAIDFALRNGRVLEGLDWREVRGELSLGVRQYRSMMVSMLLAAKFICADDPRWCERDTPLLFVVCSRGETACAVGDDLDAIARNSLTAREHRWWSSARLPL